MEGIARKSVPSFNALNTGMTILTSDQFDAVVGQTKPTIVLFAGRWSSLGSLVAFKIITTLDQDKVSIYQVDIDSPDGANVAERLSIRQSPTVILFKAGVPLLRDTDLTDEMIQSI